MSPAAPTLYPLRFEPIYQYRLWGGRRFAGLLQAPLPKGPVGEAWLLCDREDQQSRVANGPLTGQTIGDLLRRWPMHMMGSPGGRFRRFPLLLKFLDARQLLSVQVHPSDQRATELNLGESGKTEAWVVLAAEPDSCIYAGLRPGTTVDVLRAAVADKTVADHLTSFTPRVGDAVLLEAGTVHALGGGVMVFEVQQNSDLTFRLYDWDRADPKTGQHRELQVDRALASTDFSAGPVEPVRTGGAELLRCEQFGVRRLHGDAEFAVGAKNAPRVVVCIAGKGEIKNDIRPVPVRPGDTVLLPAAVGACHFVPDGPVTLLEVSLPDGK